MDEVVNAATTEEVVAQEPVAEAAPVAPEPEVWNAYTYQPTDESGRPMGGKQVIKYRTQEELVEKMQEQNVLLIRKLREETKNRRLGIDYQDEIPEEAPRLKNPVAFNPRHLSDDERVALSRDLLDPDRFSEATDTLFEATLGAKPQEIRELLSETQNKTIQQQAKIEAEAFVAANPDYVICQENFQAIVAWMQKRNLAPYRENFQRAYDTLRPVLIEKPVEEAPAVAAPVVEPVQEVHAPAPAPARIPTGLTRDRASNAGPVPAPGSDIVYELVHPTGARTTYTGKKALDVMPSDEYKRRMRDPKFAQKVDKLLSGK